LTKVVGGDLNPDSLAVQDIMTPNPEYLFYDDEIAFALNRMHVGGFRHIPLIDLNGHLRGLISVRDILDHLVRSIDDESTN
jgi:CBS domain-containing protein